MKKQLHIGIVDIVYNEVLAIKHYHNFHLATKISSKNIVIIYNSYFHGECLIDTRIYL